MEVTAVVIRSPKYGSSIGQRHLECITLVLNARAQSVEIAHVSCQLVGDSEAVEQARESCDLLHLAFRLVEDVELRAVASEVNGSFSEKRLEPAVSLSADEISPPARILKHVVPLLFGYQLTILAI